MVEARAQVFAPALAPDLVNEAAAPLALGVASSFSGRPWRFRPFDEEIARGLELSGLSAGLAQLLASRGVTSETVAAFLDPRLKTQLPDPHLLAHMERASARFADAIASGETIAVLGDYDVDGACAAAVLLRYLRGLGRAPLLYVPDRMREGYGPSAAAARSLRAQGATLLVTVDCGAASHDAMAAASACGLDAIVLDHHAVETNPPAYAHVNPNGPDDVSGVGYVCAAGLAFLFLIAVQRHLRNRGWFAAQGIAESDLLNLLDIVALATIADVVPLVGVNRALVRQGLKMLQRLERPGLAALARLASAQPPFTAYHLGFLFGPRINAGGRVGRCDLGARLLASDDPAEADVLALELDNHNRERQALEAMILESAHAMALSQADNPFVLVHGDGWHAGVVGIVAGRLKDRHAKPALVAGFEDNAPDGIARGSGRSVPGVDLGAIIRRAHSEGLLETGGGHAMAAGFSVRRSRMAAFREYLAGSMEPQSGAIALARELMADGLVSAAGATFKLMEELDRAGPYGSGHPEPVFVIPDVLLVYAGVVGANHLRLRVVGRDGQGIGAIAFRAANTPLGQRLLKARGSRVHLAGRLKQDEYEGNSKIELHLEDAAPAEM